MDKGKVVLVAFRGDRYADAPSDVADAIKSAVEVVDDFPPPSELRRRFKIPYNFKKMQKKGGGTKARRSAKGPASQ